MCGHYWYTCPLIHYRWTWHMNVLWKWLYRIRLTTWSCKCELCALWTHYTILRGPSPPLLGVCSPIWLLLGIIVCLHMHIIVWLWSHGIHPIWCSPLQTPLVKIGYCCLACIYPCVPTWSQLCPPPCSHWVPLFEVHWEVVTRTSCGALSSHGFVVDLQRTL